jgi:hypothetical protein
MTANGALRKPMPLQQFTILVDQLLTGEQLDALATRFLDLDVGRSMRKPVGHVYVDRRAPSLAEAIASAVRDVESVGLRPMSVETDHAVTIAEIADRIGQSPETVRQWSTGERGKGGFPSPLDPGRDSLYYRWSEVTAWLRERMALPIPDTDTVLAVANHVIRIRVLAPHAQRIEPLLRLLIE